MTELGQNKLGVLPYYKETPGLKRIMLLGDSVSRGIRSRTQQLFKDQANIQGAPANCMGFEKYQSGLKEWLGYCPWDLVQFNVGLHYHPEFPDNYTSWREEYRQGIIEIFKEIRAHSPSAHIVFALTTPSPFDSNATTPDKATCPHYDKFHKKGFISAMNEVAISLSQELGMIINDRYSFVLPVLEKYQNKCDVHFGVEGSKLMATEDWKLFAELLSLGKSRQGGAKSTSVAS
jgi:acyl-CoA thioesterase-1